MKENDKPPPHPEEGPSDLSELLQVVADMAENEMLYPDQKESLRGFLKTFLMKSLLPRLPEPDDGTYPCYTPHQDDPIDFLERVWGLYLKKYNPELPYNLLYQDQLQKLDHRLMKAVRNYCSTHELQVTDFIGTKSDRRSLEIELLSQEIKLFEKLIGVQRTRKQRKKKTN